MSAWMETARANARAMDQAMRAAPYKERLRRAGEQGKRKTLPWKNVDEKPAIKTLPMDSKKKVEKVLLSNTKTDINGSGINKSTKNTGQLLQTVPAARGAANPNYAQNRGTSQNTPKVQTRDDAGVRNSFAKRDHELTEIQAGLNSGEVRLETGTQELDVLRKAYEAVPSDTNAAAYNQKVASVLQERNTYNDYVDRYNHYISPQGIQERMDTIMQQMEETKEEITSAQLRFSDNGVPMDSSAIADYEKAQKTYDNLQEQYDALEVNLYRTNKALELEKYQQLMNEPDFEEYAAKGAAIQNPSFFEVEKTWEAFGTEKREDKIGNIVSYSRDNFLHLIDAEADHKSVAGSSLYEQMTDEQVSIYNYLLAKEGKQAGQAYLAAIEGQLSGKYGTELGEKISKVDGLPGVLLKGGFSIGAGVDRWLNGVKQLGTEKQMSVSPTQAASKVIQDDLSGFGKIAYQAGNSVGNLLPSVLLSSVASGLGIPVKAAKALGTMSMGASAGGNYYNKMLDQYPPEKAKQVATVVGASEAALQYALGGIGKVSGLTSDVLLARAASIGDTFTRLLAKGAIKVGSELTEEELQLFLEPFYRKLILNEDYDAPTWDEMMETAMVTILTTGALEGPGITSEAVTELEKKIQNWDGWDNFNSGGWSGFNGLQLPSSYGQLRPALADGWMDTQWQNKMPTPERDGQAKAGINFIIGKTTTNQPFVEVETDILDGVPEADWVDVVKQNLATRFPNGIELGQNTILVDSQSRGEMTWSKYMQWAEHNDKKAYEDKLKATNNSDEILQATTGWINEGPNHPRKDKIVEFARGKVLLRIGSNDYSAEVLVGKRKNGKLLLYDIYQLVPTSFIKKR